MKFILFLFFAAMIVLLLAYRQSRKKSPDSGTQQLPGHGIQNTILLSEASSTAKTGDQLPGPSGKGSILSDPHPEIIEISYSPVTQGVSPKTLGEIDQNILRIVQGKIANVKPIPPNSMKLLDLLKNPFSNWSDIATAVSTNPLFSAKVLQAVNSAFFNLPEKVSSVGRAITLLGYNNVRSLVMDDILETLTGKNKNESIDTYTKACIHSATVSACSGYLGKTIFHCSEYDLATIGLLHDIGKYFISTLEPVSGALPEAPLWKIMRPRPPLVILEQKEYGVDHAVLGSMLADRWELSDTIKYGIEYHHYPSFMPPESIPSSYVMQSMILCLSDLICKALGYGTDEDEILPVRQEYYDMFNLSGNPVDLITPILTKEVKNAYLTVRAYIDIA